MTVKLGESAEFSRRLRLDELVGGKAVRTHEANADERAALAARFGLLGLHSLSGELTVSRPAHSPLVRVEGCVRAEVTQTCVVTLEEVRAEISETFVQLFTLDAPDTTGEVFVAVDEEDAPEPLDGDHLDLGEVLAEQLALALDPYPRAPGVTFEGASFGGEELSDEDANPFAVLKSLKWQGR